MVVTVSVSKRQSRKPPQQQPGAPAQPAKPATPKPEEPDGGPGPEPVPGHNGGRSQLNFNFLQTGGAFPFINHFKGAQTWSLADNTTAPAPDTLNANGYPISISNGGVYTVFSIPSAASRPGNWRFRWKGTGRLAATGFPATTGTDGDLTGSPGTTSINIYIYSGTDISDVQFFHEDDEALLDAGEVFNTRFLEILREGNWGVLRFLDWQAINGSNVVRWDEMKPVDYVYYAGGMLKASIYAGATTNSGDAYSCAAPPDWEGLVDKAHITVKYMAAATTVNPTLNVGGTGAKKILSRFGGTLHTNNKPGANRFGTLMFDADLDGWITHGGDNNEYYNRFIDNGIPMPLILRLCEEVGAHPWVIPPYLSCDPITDWTTELATYFRDNAPAWMIPRYEATPNEVWNANGAFFATTYANNKAIAEWGLPNNSYHEWVGKVASLQGQAVSAVYGDDRSRYWSIVGVQTHGGTGTQQNARLLSTAYVTKDGGLPAKDWVTHVATANYYNDTYTSAQETAAATDWAAGTDAAKVAVCQDYVNSALAANTAPLGVTQFGLVNLVALMTAYKAWAESHGVDGLTFYEGGWSPDFASGQGAASTDLDKMKDQSRMMAELDQITLDLYEDLLGLGGEFPSHYFLSGGGAWSLFSRDVYATPSPQYDAIVTFNTP